MRTRVWISGLLLLLSAPAFAEPGPGRITVRSEPQGAHIYLDTLFVGVTPATIDSLEGVVVIRVLGPETSNWLAPVVLDTLVLRPGQDTTLHYRLETRYYVNTIPSGAQVFVGDSLAGLTPLVFADSLFARGSSLALKKEGFEDARIGPTAFSSTSLILPLSLLPGSSTEKALALGSQLPSPDRLRLHLSGYSTLLFGLMTAYLKSRADDANDAYLRTQDPVYLDRRNRLDSQAAISIVATEIALGFFIYFLLLE